MLAIFLIFFFFTLSAIKSTYGLAFLIVTLSVNTTLLFGIDVNFIIKILFFVSALWNFCKYGIRKDNIKLFGYSIGILMFSQILASYTINYSLIVAVQAMMSIIIGIILVSVEFKADDRIFLLKVISGLPYFSIIFGMYSFRSLAFGGRYSAGTTPTNLAFLCAVSVVSLVSLYNRMKRNRYIILAIFSFVICFFTLTRGGILFCTIILLPCFADFIKKLKKSQFVALSICLIVIIVAIINNWQQLIQRMYTDTGEINSSGRLAAWNYILSLNKKIWVGEGFGKLFTLTFRGRYIDHFNAAHNEFVRFYYEAGILGCVLLLIMFIKIFKNYINGNALNKTQTIMIIIAFIIYSLVDNTISNYVFFIPFMLYLNTACLIGNCRRIIVKWRK